MAKKTKKRRNNSLTIIAAILTVIGKPFYFVLSKVIIALLFIPYLIGHSTSLIFGFVNRLLKTSKKRGGKKAKTKVKAVKLPKVTFPKLPLQGIVDFLRLENLRVVLFELKIWSGVKKLFIFKISRFQKFRLKKKVFLITTVLLFLLFAFSVYSFIFKGLPSPKELGERNPEVSTKIYDRNRVLLYKIYKDKNRTIISLNEIPLHVRLATLAAEDAEFYNHPGFSIKGISRAIVQNTKSGSLQGGSTITQQLVKNTLLSSERTIIRKIKEIILSVEVESTYTKDQILEMYMNEVSYGGTAYGIEEAARTYFDKNVNELTLSEAALLAGLPQSPTQFSPFGQNPDLAFERQREVLRLMKINRFITESQEEEALGEKITFAANKTQIEAPHFVLFVRQLLVDKYGEEMVEKGGLEVTTSLDLGIQKMAEQVVGQEVDKLKNLNVGNGAALILNPQTSEILGMVGSKNYFDVTNDGQVNVTTRLRQPGSSIKVVNYAYALANGYTPASIIDDSPITYVTPGSPPYSPKNYDGEFRGKITLRSALAESRNIPAVKILASYGVAKMIEMGEKMGITSWQDRTRYGLSLTLGGGGVKLLELAKVYATIANYGTGNELVPILSVKDYKGRTLEKYEPEGRQVLDKRVSYLLIDILKDNKARSPEFGLNSYLVVKNHPEVAVKTGTSNDLRDNITAGFNQNYLVVTWVGNNDNSPMSRIASGVTGASPIWNKIMTALLAGHEAKEWEIPDGLVKLSVCSKIEWFLSESKPRVDCPSPEPTPTPPAGPQILDGGASTQRGF